MDRLATRRRYVEADYADHIKPHNPLATMPYDEYLQTQEWQQHRRRALERAGHKCQLCGARDVPFHVHHNTYDNRGAELDSDLIVLCAPCHEWYHNKQNEDEYKPVMGRRRYVEGDYAEHIKRR